MAIELDTGSCTVLRYAVAHEGGVSINPLIVEGQIVGGVAQGIGGALLEEFGYGPDGQPQSGTFADYLLPTASEVPRVDVRLLHVHTDSNPLGVRGVGESGTIAVYAALAAAIDAALGSDALRVTTTPISPERIVELVDRRRRGAVDEARAL